MDLILSFEKDTLERIRKDLVRLNKVLHRGSSSAFLQNVNFPEFACVLLQHIHEKRSLVFDLPGFFQSAEYDSIMRCITYYFDIVDVDSRGVISYTDFTNYCLRAGRMRFKPSLKRPVALYNEDHSSQQPTLPLRQLTYIPITQTLFAFESDSPQVRMFRYSSPLSSYDYPP